MRPRALDLFCSAGGASMGLHLAGFDVTGVDIKPQPRYPFRFVQADALTFPLRGMRNETEFDFVWASPPCQRYSQCTPKEHRAKHPDLIATVRRRMREWATYAGGQYCIENVPSAAKHLLHPVKLCGSMFGLRIQRHRFFEANFYILAPQCQHTKSPVLITGTHRRTYEPRYEYTAQQCRDASGLHWMTRREMDEAIPPAYSEFIGHAALQNLRAAA